ncbi:MAG TPA: aldo/keto reductase [Dehalococcoidia bacterium]|nr:aldo/keto reductase [Dehalococcoidia bacterium]
MIDTLTFGKTGHPSTRTIFGAAAFMRCSQEVADATLPLLFQHGINHIDVAASYGDAELRLGPWMEQHRDRFFLATKTGERTYAAARDQIRRSLERLRVPYVDLIQLHNLTDPAEWEVALGPDGALKAAIEARDQGLVRFIGVTGHGVIAPSIHKRSLDRFPFDSVLLPLNYPMLQNEQYRSDFYALLEVCQQRNVAVQTIKAITLGPWEERPHDAATWYEPLREQEDIDTAVHWVLGQPGVYLNTASDVTLLPKILDAAERFDGHRPDDETMQALVDRQNMAPLFV